MGNGSVVVQFYGICTHVRMEGTPYRVILPNAGPAQIDGNDVLKRQRMQSHIARLQIRNEDLDLQDPLPPWFVRENHPTHAVWRLEGITLSIGNASAEQPATTPASGAALPSLNAYSCSPVTLRQETLLDNEQAQRELTDCIFALPDVAPVAMRTSEGAEGRRATVATTTIATVAAPILSVQQFGTKETISLPLRDGAQITVYSYPEFPGATTDKDADFLLHFLSATEVPPRSWYPPAPPWEECTTEIVTNNPPIFETANVSFTGPGCSNSQYP
jgi:hypothetical protein